MLLSDFSEMCFTLQAYSLVQTWGRNPFLYSCNVSHTMLNVQCPTYTGARIHFHLPHKAALQQFNHHVSFPGYIHITLGLLGTSSFLAV